MTDSQGAGKLAPKIDQQQVEQDASWLGKRLSEPSTYAGLATLLALIFHISNADHLAVNLQTIGIALGTIILAVLAIIKPEGAGKAFIACIVAGAAAALMFAPARAQATTAPACALDILQLVPGCKQKNGTIFSVDTVWQNIQKAAIADLTYAKALADAANTPGSKLRAQCYAAILAAQASGAALKDAQGNALTEPGAPANLISEAEKGAEIIDALQPTSSVSAGCAPAAQALKMNTLTLVNALVTGAATQALTAGMLP
jgi:hypothetical protein